jgi:ornithine cyclodeaminase
MTLFVDVSDLGRLVNHLGVAEFMAGLLDYLEQDFCRWQRFDKSARTAAHSKVGVIELMPIADEQGYGFKYVNGHPANPAQGLPTVMAFGALADMATGYPKLLSELTLATALRTAVTSAMAARALARDDSRIMAMIGCGAQGEFQAIAFHTLVGITELRIFDIDTAAMAKLVRHLEAFPALKVSICTSAQGCVQGADIVTTVTADKSKATILSADMLAPGMHINGVGGDCPGKTELAIEVLEAAKIFVEHEPQTRIEGDIQQLAAEHPVHPLWAVIAKQLAGRDHREQITLFDSVGFALEDYSTLRFIYDMATKLNLGRQLELVPQLTDPKDLYGRLCDDNTSQVRKRA